MNISQFLLKSHSSEHMYDSDSLIEFPKPEGYTFASSIRKFEVFVFNRGQHVLGIQKLFSKRSNYYDKIDNDFLIDNYCIFNFMGLNDHHPSDYIHKDFFHSVDQIQKKIEDYLNAPNDRKIDMSGYGSYYRFRSIIEYFTGDFFVSNSSWWRIPTIHVGSQTTGLIRTRLFVENGNIYYVEKDIKERAYPLLSLMVQDDYVDDFKVRSILNLPLDYSKFRYWIDSSIFNLRQEDPNSYKAFIKLLNTIDKTIKIEFKDNLSINFINFSLPELNTISDRKLWLNSIKNGFVNKKHNKSLPFNKMKVIKKVIQNPDALKLSGKSYKRILEKQLENQYELIS